MEDNPIQDEAGASIEPQSTPAKKTRSRTTKKKTAAKPRASRAKKAPREAEDTAQESSAGSQGSLSLEQARSSENAGGADRVKPVESASAPSGGEPVSADAAPSASVAGNALDSEHSSHSGESSEAVGHGADDRSQGGRQDYKGGQKNRDDRGNWKRGNKRKKRGRNGNWQSGGGSQHPAQPGPASAPVISGDLPAVERHNALEKLEAVATELASGSGDPVWLDELYSKTHGELTTFVRSIGAELEGVPTRDQLLKLAFEQAVAQKRPIRDRGYIDINAVGAFIVHESMNYRLYPEDAYLPELLIKHHGLKRGHRVEVLVQAPQDSDRCPLVVRVETAMGSPVDEISKVTPFEELVPYYPLERIHLEAEAVQKDVSMRAVDILTPVGFGQRGLIVAPPRTGKTVLMQNMANSISENFPEVTLILLLIDERPEEVTDFKRHTKGEVVSSTFDESPENHVHCAEMVGEKSRRLVEQGKHVVILLDSITRLARAYNALASNSGKMMSGGMEATALQKPKRFFGAARNIEGGGSLTIVGTALVDTGSRMDEVIFEEFKGTGNMELHLDRGLVERRIFPAINIDRSGTRKEELIYHPDELQKIFGLRRAMQGLGPIESMEMLIQRLKKTKSNPEFLLGLR